jgi:hypothetical protein
MLTHLMQPRQRLARLVVLVGWMALITYWSSQGNLPIDQLQVANVLHGFQHRLAHLVAFGLLGLLARWAFDGLPRATVWAIVLASAFGATDEWHQSFTPGRNPRIDDWATDTAFAALALFGWARLRQTSLRPTLRALAPMAVAAMFAVGVGLAVYPTTQTVKFLHDPDRPSLRNVPTQVALTARDVARSTRNLARQLRDGVF